MTNASAAVNAWNTAH